MPDDLPPLFGRDGDLGVGYVPPRLPPSNQPAEQALLGAILANNKAYDRVAGFLNPDHFSDPINGKIYEAIARRLATGNIADPITLNAEFARAGTLDDVGGTAYLTGLLTAMVGIINAGDYGRVVLDTWMRRELIDIGGFMVDEAYGNGRIDATKIAMDAVSMMDSVVAGSGPLLERSTTLDSAMDLALQAMQTKSPTGASTGFKCFNQRLGGLEPGLVYVLAGRPGMGKSALGHKICLSVAKKMRERGERSSVLELSLEMSAMQLARRALAIEARVNIGKIKSGVIDNDEAASLVAARQTLAGLPLTIDDAGGQTPRMITAKAREIKRKNGLGLVMVDHLNLTRPDGNDASHGPTHVIERASGQMLQLAKDLNVPVLLLTQLNRGPEGREDKRPNLSDLRQSGAIEQDAYAIGFVYRAEYYGSSAPERKDGETEASFVERINSWGAQRTSIRGRAEVIWAKVRDGEPGPDSLMFDAETTNFYEEWVGPDDV